MLRASILLTALFAFACRPSVPEPMFEVAEFRLQDQEGQPYGSKELRGRVWIADFFFTTCRSVCLELTAKMKVLQADLEDRGLDVGLVSITVDPEQDRPEVLAKYADQHGADPDRWRFLTGTLQEVRRVVVDHFKHPMEPEESDDQALMRIAHGARFVLVDRDHRVRGLFGTEAPDLKALLTQASRL